MPHLDLSKDEAIALMQELQKTIDNDCYSRSPHIRTLKAILTKLGPAPVHREPLPPAKVAHAFPSARYLVQILSKAGWKEVAYINNPEEVGPTLENVPELRVFDTWENAEVRLHDLPQVQRKTRSSG